MDGPKRRGALSEREVGGEKFRQEWRDAPGRSPRTRAWRSRRLAWQGYWFGWPGVGAGLACGAGSGGLQLLCLQSSPSLQGLPAASHLSSFFSFFFLATWMAPGRGLILPAKAGVARP